MKFNPEDGQDTGPRCRNCHKGASGCGACHNTDPADPVEGINRTGATANAQAVDKSKAAITYLFAAMFDMAAPYDPTGPALSGWATMMNQAAGGGAGNYAPLQNNFAPVTAYVPDQTSIAGNGPLAGLGNTNGLLKQFSTQNNVLDANNQPIIGQVKNSRTVSWSNWRASAGVVNPDCADDGLSFPHRTLGWKMLKDDLFGIDPQGAANDNNANPGAPRIVYAGQTRTGLYGNGLKAHDLDSVCLDCHNPTIWNATSQTDHNGNTNPYNNDLLLRGLP